MAKKRERVESWLRDLCAGVHHHAAASPTASETSSLATLEVATTHHTEEDDAAAAAPATPCSPSPAHKRSSEPPPAKSPRKRARATRDTEAGAPAVAEESADSSDNKIQLLTEVLGRDVVAGLDPERLLNDCGLDVERAAALVFASPAYVQRTYKPTAQP